MKKPVECPSKLIYTSKSSSNDNLSLKDDVFEAWFTYNLCQQRGEDMNDSKIGGLPSSNEQIQSFINRESSSSHSFKEQYINYLKKQTNGEQHQQIFINYCALLVIKQFAID